MKPVYGTYGFWQFAMTEIRNGLVFSCWSDLPQYYSDELDFRRNFESTPNKLKEVGDMRKAEKLLKRLKNERGKYSKSSESYMQGIIDELVDMGFYPRKPTKAMAEHNYSILDMVRNYGVFWCKYDEPFECPYCRTDLRSEEGPPYKREIGMTDLYLDRTVDQVCPDCFRSINSGEQYNRHDYKKSEVPEELKGD